MPQLPSTVTSRPTLTVDARRSVRLVDIAAPIPAHLGTAGLFGRGRMVTCLPTNGDGPVLIRNAVAFADPSAYLVDPDGNFVGVNNAVYVHRIVYARWTEDSRRLGG